MTIRNKLFILLLAIGLIPLIIASLLQQLSIRKARIILAREIKQNLEMSARATLKQALQNYNRIMIREKHLTEAILKQQAREAEIRLAGKPKKANLNKITENDFFIPEGVKLQDVIHDLARLATMKNVYKQLFKIGPRGILWCYTCLETGLLMSYPPKPPTSYPKQYDPRKRNWYLQTKRQLKLTISPPYIDASTKKTVITTAMPIKRPDNSFAGVTAIDREMPEILSEMKLPPQWTKNAKKMILKYNPADDSLTILIQSSYAETKENWTKTIKLEKLKSQNDFVFRKMIADIKIGKSGVKKMPYKGKTALWVYARFHKTPFVSLLIIPYERVIELANKLENSLLSESLTEIRTYAILMLVILAIAVMLASERARHLTNPIIELIEANKKLAKGDYEAHVNIKTSDELQMLGQIFNETGPKLKEHAKMKQSLELARAIQQHLLPKHPPTLKNFDIAAKCKYCDETGGDYYDFIEFNDNSQHTIALALGDVTGHGISAAMLMASARSILRNCARYFSYDLTKLMQEFNNQLTQDTDDNMFMTLFYAILNDDEKSITWASAGHDPAILYHENGKSIDELPNTGMIAGLMENIKYSQEGPIPLSKGDIIVIGTDGIWEAMNPQKQMFSKDRLHKIIRQNATQSAENLCKIVIDSVIDFTKPAFPQDDITLIVIKTL